MSLAIVESLPCGVCPPDPRARDGRNPTPRSCPAAPDPSRGRNVCGRRSGEPFPDQAPAPRAAPPGGVVTLDRRVPDHHKHSGPESANSSRSEGGRSALALLAAFVAGLGDRDEGDAGLVLVALAHFVDADLLGEPPGAVRVVLVAIEHDGLLLDVVGGGDAHVLPSLTLEVVAPGSGHAVDPAGVDHQHGGGPVGLGGRFLGVLLLGGGVLAGLARRRGRGIVRAVVGVAPHAPDQEQQHHQQHEGRRDDDDVDQVLAPERLLGPMRAMEGGGIGLVVETVRRVGILGISHGPIKPAIAAYMQEHTPHGCGGSGDPAGVAGPGRLLGGGAPVPQPVDRRGRGPQGLRVVQQGVEPHVVGGAGDAELLADGPLLRPHVAEGARLELEDPTVAVGQSGAIGGVGVGVRIGHAPSLRAQREGTAAARRHTGGRGWKTGHMPQPLSEIISADWAHALAPAEQQVRALGEFLRAEIAAGRGYLPAGDRVLRAFTRPMADVRVLIVGQDPYPTPGHPIGLSFAVERDVRPLPRSLVNIYAELESDLGLPPAPHGDLSAWQDQGVLLLNRVLTVAPGAPASHRGRGWEAITELAIRSLVEREGPLVAVLWGRDAQSLVPMLGEVPYVASPHPSPLSASRGFFGSRPFSRVNELLEKQGAAGVDWRVEPDGPTG